MVDLPPGRVQQCRPFARVGIDFAGPLQLKRDPFFTMAAKVSVNIFYVCDNSYNSLFKGIYAIKTVNDNIEEIDFNLETRIESRSDIDMIIKNFDAITVCIMEKEIILRLINDSVKIISVRRSKGMSFELVRAGADRPTGIPGLSRCAPILWAPPSNMQ